MAKLMKGLGRGLEALLAETRNDDVADSLQAVPVARLQPGKYQPRSRMDQVALAELAASIRAQGLMQPILVRPLVNGAYEIIAGERRWRAAQLAELKEVPVVVRQVADEAALAMALIENIQRENLNPLEEAQGIKRLVDEFGLTHEQAADAVGRSRPATSNLLRLLQLSATVQDLLMDGKLDMGHARALLPLKSAQQVAAAQVIVSKGLSVREAERLVQQALNPPKASAARPINRDVLRLQEELSDTLGAAVVIQSGKQGRGRITIEFSDLDQLEGLIERFRQ